MSEQRIHKIKVLSLLGHGTATSTDDGQELFRRINTAFEVGDIVELDFEGIELIISAFMNAAIGQLYSKYDSEFIRDHILLKNLSNEDLFNLKMVTDTAKLYFKDRNRFKDLMSEDFGDE